MEKEQKQPWFLSVPVARYKDIDFNDGYKYDYRWQILLDIHDYCIENCVDLPKRLLFGSSSFEEIENELFELCINDDSVTGNPSGSYWFSQWYAESALCHNYDLLVSVLDEFDEAKSLDLTETFPEILDVKIRCYLLADCIHDYVNEIFRCYVQD